MNLKSGLLISLIAYKILLASLLVNLANQDTQIILKINKKIPKKIIKISLTNKNLNWMSFLIV